MVLEAVREDRMPGGRNGSAIYNLYKVGIPSCFCFLLAILIYSHTTRIKSSSFASRFFSFYSIFSASDRKRLTWIPGFLHLLNCPPRFLIPLPFPFSWDSADTFFGAGGKAGFFFISFLGKVFLRIFSFKPFYSINTVNEFTYIFNS
jgi:hypothetical protein